MVNNGLQNIKTEVVLPINCGMMNKTTIPVPVSCVIVIVGSNNITLFASVK